MSKQCIFFVLLSALAACREEAKKPDDILSRDEMVKVLTELYIAEQKVTTLALGIDSSRKAFDLMQHKVFDRTGVPDSVFKRSINYYVEHPKELEQIYSVLVDSLQLREQRVSP
jgi:hypothetical protein